MVDPRPAAGLLAGRVTAFDHRRGLGAVETTDGATYGFHATAITDGTRTIAVGTSVTLHVGPGHRGLYEAWSVTAVPAPAAG